MATTSTFDPDSASAVSSPSEPVFALAKTPQTFIDLLTVLSQASQAVQSGADQRQTTALLQRAMALVSSLSVAILVPDAPAAASADDTLHGLNKLSLREEEDGDDCPYDGSNAFLAMQRNSSDDGSSFSTTPSSPPPPSPTLSGASGPKQHQQPQQPLSSSKLALQRTAPGTPKHGLLPPGFASALLTPPSETKLAAVHATKQLNIHAKPVIFRPENGGELIIPSPQLVEMPAGFQSSLVPSISDADFRARATFHRTRGHGVQEAYDITLGLLGATTIDGVTVNFKVVDSYLNEESLNYSESLQTPSGVTGYRYDNRNGSTYVRFDEPTGPRTLFVRHAHPPFVVNGPGAHRSPAVLGSPFTGAQHQHHQYQRHPQQQQQQPHGFLASAAHHSALLSSPTPNRGLGFGNLLPTPESSFVGLQGSPLRNDAGKFSVHDLWA